MSTAISDWLPADAVTAERLGKAWRPVLAGWQEHWFVSRNASITVCESEARVPAVADWHVVSVRPHVDLHIHRTAHRLLLQRLLGAQPAGGELTQVDRTVIDDLVRAVTRDLGARLFATLGDCTDAGAPRSRYEMHIEGSHAFTFACPSAALVAPVRSAIARTPALRAPVPVVSAIAGCDIAVQADLGTCDIGLADLHALTPGDILVLDEHLGSSATLRAQDGTQIAFGVLVDVDGRNGLKIQ